LLIRDLVELTHVPPYPGRAKPNLLTEYNELKKNETMLLD
jgi:hypothetical protein